MSIKDRRQTLQPIGWIKDMHTAGMLDLDPPYQRRSVWNKSYKQFFIDTVISHYPIPPIFVNLEVTEGGRSIYHVIDGKQRLTAVLEFLEDRFPLAKDSKQPDSLRGKYFSQLEQATQRDFWAYFLPFEVFTDISAADVEEIYDRFNRNVQRLNDQELRHARFGGTFITVMEQMADEPFWREIGLFNQSDLRRMKDVEFLSTLFVLTMHGILDTEDLDYYYAEYDEEIPDGGAHLQKFNTVRAVVSELKELVRTTRFRNKADFYSLWSALVALSDGTDQIDYVKTVLILREFAKRVDEVPELKDASEADPDALAYSQNVRAGTTKAPNRMIRRDILLKRIIRT